MGRMVGMAEFKANCTRLLREVEQGGEPITVTVRGKPVAVVNAPEINSKRRSALGALKGFITIHGDIVGPVDPDWEAQWEANNAPDLYNSRHSELKP